MTDKEYFALINTFSYKFQPTLDTCELVSITTSKCRCQNCYYYDSIYPKCKLDIGLSSGKLDPEFLNKIIKHHPEQLI